MANFKVIDVIDGDTFKVEGGWKSGDTTGDVVRPTGYNTPEKGQPGYEAATKKLRDLILGKTVYLGRAVNFDHGRIVCPVNYGGKDLAEYFPEYKC